MNYVIVRGDRSGVFAGELERREGHEVLLRHARRLATGPTGLDALLRQVSADVSGERVSRLQRGTRTSQTPAAWVGLVEEIQFRK